MTWIRALIVLALPAWAACSHSKPQVAAEEPRATAPVAAPAPAEAKAAPAAAAEAVACKVDDDCKAGQLCVSSTCRAIVPGMTECQAAAAHFGFDRWDVEERDVPALRRAARCLEAGGATRAVVAGNCDERGTTQYNVALGFRRAASIQKYLEALGVPAARLETVSYGEETPLCRDATEACWAKNRRADVSPGGAGQAPRGAAN